METLLPVSSVRGGSVKRLSLRNSSRDPLKQVAGRFDHATATIATQVTSPKNADSVVADLWGHTKATCRYSITGGVRGWQSWIPVSTHP